MVQDRFALAFSLFAVGSLAPAQDGGEKAAVDFVTQIRPILVEHCYECHGPKEQEADLRFDRRDAVFTKDESAWVIQPGNPDESLLCERITLPADDPDIMPAEGEPLDAKSIALIKQWIAEGAKWPDEAAVHEVAADKPVVPTIETEPLSEAEAAAEQKALAALTEKNVLAMRIAKNTQALDVNFSLSGKEVTDETLSGLAGLEKTLVWLNLARTAITDAGLARLAAHSALQRLDLSQTAITDAGLAHLKGQKQLRYLNLYGTKVSDAGLAALAQCTSLEKLFVWQSGVTEAGVARLREAIPGVHVDRGDYVDVIRKTADEVAAAKAKAEEEKKAFRQPINANCPVTGKPVNAEFVVIHEEQAIGFCCEKCKAKFEADPAELVKKVAEFKPKSEEPKAEKKESPKPINATCPVSGKPVDVGFVVVHQDQAIGFCCGKCKARFEADPTELVKKVAEFKAK